MPNFKMFVSVASASSSSEKLVGTEAPAGREGEVLRVVGLRVLDDDDLALLSGS